MKRVVLVRHGEYGPDDHLDERGYRQLTDLCLSLDGYFRAWGRIQLLTSTADRAMESAEILARVLPARPEALDLLWSERSHPEDLAGLFRLLEDRADLADTFVLVTHFEYVNEFPSFFASQKWGRPLLPDEASVTRLTGKGRALILDCTTQACVPVR